MLFHFHDKSEENRRRNLREITDENNENICKYTHNKAILHPSKMKENQ